LQASLALWLKLVGVKSDAGPEWGLQQIAPRWLRSRKAGEGFAGQRAIWVS
jgi:hypothetical protein